MLFLSALSLTSLNSSSLHDPRPTNASTIRRPLSALSLRSRALPAVRILKIPNQISTAGLSPRQTIRSFNMHTFAL
jgi:hypothetical protein